MCRRSGRELLLLLTPWWRRQARERQLKVNRWTAVVLGLLPRTVQPAGSLISWPPFPSKISFSPLIPLRCASGFFFFFAWNTEIACVLFYLSGIQQEFPLQPTAGSGMSCYSPLKSPLTSSPPCPAVFLYVPLLPYTALSPHPFSPLSKQLCSGIISPSALSAPRYLSARLFRDGSSEGASIGKKDSASAKAHKLLTANTRSCCGDRITYG